MGWSGLVHDLLVKLLLVLVDLAIGIIRVLDTDKLVAIGKQLIDAFFNVVLVLFEGSLALRLCEAHFHEGLDVLRVGFNTLRLMVPTRVTRSNDTEVPSICHTECP